MELSWPERRNRLCVLVRDQNRVDVLQHLRCVERTSLFAPATRPIWLRPASRPSLTRQGPGRLDRVDKRQLDERRFADAPREPHTLGWAMAAKPIRMLAVWGGSPLPSARSRPSR